MFIHLPVNHLADVEIITFINKAAININVQVFVPGFFFHFSWFLEMKYLSHTVIVGPQSGMKVPDSLLKSFNHSAFSPRTKYQFFYILACIW